MKMPRFYTRQQNPEMHKWILRECPQKDTQREPTASRSQQEPIPTAPKPLQAVSKPPPPRLQSQWCKEEPEESRFDEAETQAGWDGQGEIFRGHSANALRRIRKKKQKKNQQAVPTTFVPLYQGKGWNKACTGDGVELEYAMQPASPPPSQPPSRKGERMPIKKGGQGWIPPVPPAPVSAPTPTPTPSIAPQPVTVPQKEAIPQAVMGVIPLWGVETGKGQGLGQVALNQVQAMLQPLIQQQQAQNLLLANQPAPSMMTGQMMGAPHQMPKPPKMRMRVCYDSSSSDDETPMIMMPMKKKPRKQEEKTMWIQTEDKCFKARYKE